MNTRNISLGGGGGEKGAGAWGRQPYNLNGPTVLKSGTCMACPGLYRDCFDIQPYVSSTSFGKNAGFLVSFLSCTEPIIQQFSTVLYIVSHSTVDGFFWHHSDCNFSHDTRFAEVLQINTFVQLNKPHKHT
jgi:hypothetical protein